MPKCLFCRSVLVERLQLFYCSDCQAYFTDTDHGLKYKQVLNNPLNNLSQNTTGLIRLDGTLSRKNSDYTFVLAKIYHFYTIKLCKECEKRKNERFVVRNFSQFLRRVNICTDCKNNNIDALRNEYYWNLDRKHVQMYTERRYFIVHILIVILCFIWDKSLFLLLLSIPYINNYAQGFEIILLLIIWSMFGTYTIFYLLIYILQLRHLCSLKFTRFVIRPDMKQLSEHFSELKI